MRRPPIRLPLLAAMQLAVAQPVKADIAWERQFYDLGAERSDLPEPDLVLPMPCGGAMAFQKVKVGVDATDPLADREVRLGQSGTEFGYMEYLRQEFLRGSFTEAGEPGTFYFIARYELTELQYEALVDPACDLQPSIRAVLPKLGLSWFQATDLARIYTEWLRTNTPEALPTVNGEAGFLRLPTETEWEFAARGGEAVDPIEFGALRPGMTEEPGVYAQFDQDAPTPAGAHAPNPLLIFDMLGNAEELAMEPFRLNAVGHLHGQSGGVVTRGGSFRSSAEDMRPSRRSEWPPFNRTTGQAQAQDTFGARFVIAAPVMTSDAHVDAVDEAWHSAFSAGAEIDVLPVEVIGQLIAAELDPRRRAALEALQLSLSRSQDAADRASRAQVAATLEMASAISENIRIQDGRIAGMRDYIAYLDEQLESLDADQGGDPDLVEQTRADTLATRSEFEAEIPALEALRRDLLGSYREALVILDRTDPATLAREFAMFEDRLASRGNATLAAAAHGLSGDLAVFGQAPDMDGEALLRLVLDSE